MNNALNRGQPYPCSFKLFGAVKTLEDAKQFVGILHIEANSIISNKHHDPIVLFLGATHLDLGLWTRAREFYSIGEKIDERELEHRTIAVQIGHRAELPGNISPPRLLGYFALNFLYQLFQVNRALPGLSAPDS